MALKRTFFHWASLHNDAVMAQNILEIPPLELPPKPRAHSFKNSLNGYKSLYQESAFDFLN